MQPGDDQEGSKAMSVAVHEAELLNPRDQLRRMWEELDPPRGGRAEIVEGTLIVVPPPANSHNSVADLLHELLVFAKPTDWGVYQTQGVQIGSTGDIYIPDLLVYPRDQLPARGFVAPAEHAQLVVEITSPSNADHDRKTKLWGYAHAPVPLYLLVDPHAADGPHVTLHSRPENGAYQTIVRRPFGEVVEVPEPFDLKIDTARFRIG
jgi:Uma2 family endonuclease